MASNHPRPTPPDLSSLQAGARETLQTFLFKVTARCQQSWHLFHHLGFLPHKGLNNKFPYYQ